MATRENNTMAEGCDKLLKQIASMEQEPDADMEFLGALRGDILTYLKPPTPGGPPSADSVNALGSPMGQAMGQVMGGGGGAPGPAPGGAPMSMGITSGDELRRTMGRASRQQVVKSLLGRLPVSMA